MTERPLTTRQLADREMSDFEHRERLESMVEDNGQTWDLSDNDKAAIRWALAKIEEDDERWSRLTISALDESQDSAPPANEQR